MKITLKYSSSSLLVLFSSCDECEDTDSIKKLTVDNTESEDLEIDDTVEGWLIVDEKPDNSNLIGSHPIIDGSALR